MAKSAAQRQREYRERKRAGQVPAAADSSLESLCDSVRRQATGFTRAASSAHDLKAAVEAVEKIYRLRQDAGELVARADVRGLWQRSMQAFGARVASLTETLPEALVTAAPAGPAAVKDVLDRELRGAFETLRAAPTTWPKELRF